MFIINQLKDMSSYIDYKKPQSYIDTIENNKGIITSSNQCKKPKIMELDT